MPDRRRLFASAGFVLFMAALFALTYVPGHPARWDGWVTVGAVLTGLLAAVAVVIWHGRPLPARLRSRSVRGSLFTCMFLGIILAAWATLAAAGFEEHVWQAVLLLVGLRLAWRASGQIAAWMGRRRV